ncbi:MAG: hypothetical protein WBP29_05350 [Candidatus Zixiibacteriota bacterium]
MVKPIAIVDNLAKTPLAERVNQIQKVAPDTDQRHAAQVSQQLEAQKHQAAQAAEKTDEAIIHRDKQQQAQHQNEKKKQDKDKEKKSGLDVTA